MQPITERLIGVFGTPNHVETAAAFLAEVDRIADRYGHEAQRLAGDMVIRATQQNWWPSPGVIAEALDSASNSLAVKNADKGPKYPDWTAARQANANRLIRSPMGRQAAAEGWIGALWDFARVEERLPQGSEMARCKRIAREADEAAASIYRMTAVPALVRLAQSREEKHRQLAEIANGYEAGTLTERSRQMAGEG